MPRGGKRKGAGRPKNSGKFGEPTKAVRLPVSKIDRIMQMLEQEVLESEAPDASVHQGTKRRTAAKNGR